MFRDEESFRRNKWGVIATWLHSGSVLTRENARLRSVERYASRCPSGELVLQLDPQAGGCDSARAVILDLTSSIIGPQCLAITSPNGSGKTTFLEIITGQLNSDIARALNPGAPR